MAHHERRVHGQAGHRDREKHRKAAQTLAAGRQFGQAADRDQQGGGAQDPTLVMMELFMKIVGERFEGGNAHKTDRAAGDQCGGHRQAAADRVKPQNHSMGRMGAPSGSVCVAPGVGAGAVVAVAGWGAVIR